MIGVSPLAWAVLASGAAIVGFSKTAIGGAAMIAVAFYAMVLPTRESTGVLLVLLMTGDVIAIWSYRRHADWPLLGKLVLPVLAGIIAGALFLARVPAGWVAPAIGIIVVVMAVLEIAQRLRRRRGGPGPQPASPATSAPSGPGGGRGFGALAGFTTMVANAGGPVMSLYLLRANLGVVRFVGTLAWFFAVVNLIKLPFSIGLGLVQPSRFALILTLIPAVLAGAFLGRWLITRIPRAAFEWTILLVTLLTGIILILS